jgi:hypothetical protein
MDLLTQIAGIVRDAIETGIITSVSLDEFDDASKLLSEYELEAYLQALWDEL